MKFIVIFHKNNNKKEPTQFQVQINMNNGSSLMYETKLI